MRLNRTTYIYLGIGIPILAILALTFRLVVPKRTPTQPASMSALFIYNPQKKIGTEKLTSFNTDEPAFSIKLPDGWYFDKERTGNKRLIAQSQTTTVKGYEFRATIMISMVPTKNDLDKEVAIAKQAISTLAVNHTVQIARPVKLNGYPAYQLEYDIYRKEDIGTLKPIIGADNPTVHNVDIITVKDGYLVDIAATSFAWQWKDYVTTIQKSLNSFTFLP